MTALVRRVGAVEAALARFNGQPFVWGRNDCGRLAAFVLKALGVRLSLLKVGRYDSALAARRRLKALGADTMADLLDKHLPSVAPATLLPGDLAALPGDEMGEAIVVYVGNGRVFGFKDGVGGVVQPAVPLTRAWRSV